MTTEDALGLAAGELPPAPRNVKITVEYDGTRYCGWERQTNGVGIQQLIEEAVERITGERTTVNGSGRTDAGVHARGQVASFTIQHGMAASDLGRALDAILPEDVGVIDACVVPLTFHARFSASRKLYRYRILNRRPKGPLLRHMCWHVRAPLRDDDMRTAAAALCGTHDFTAFGRETHTQTSCVRTIFRLDVERGEDDVLTFDVEGDGFLYNMVRIITGTLVHVGLGKLRVSDIERIIDSKDRTQAGPTAPPHGLCLERVFYD